MKSFYAANYQSIFCALETPPTAFDYYLTSFVLRAVIYIYIFFIL